jgi:hypothetical protein
MLFDSPDITELKISETVYESDETISSNCPVKIAFPPSRRLGRKSMTSTVLGEGDIRGLSHRLPAVYVQQVPLGERVAQGTDTDLKTPKTANKTGRKCHKLQNFSGVLRASLLKPPTRPERVNKVL